MNPNARDFGRLGFVYMNQNLADNISSLCLINLSMLHKQNCVDDKLTPREK